MDDNSKGGAFFLCLLGIFGIAILLTKRGGGNKPLAYHTEPATGWEIVHPHHAVTSAPIPIYENEERWELVRGPDRLIEEIVIHRKVTQND